MINEYVGHGLGVTLSIIGVGLLDGSCQRPTGILGSGKMISRAKAAAAAGIIAREGQSFRKVRVGSKFILSKQCLTQLLSSPTEPTLAVVIQQLRKGGPFRVVRGEVVFLPKPHAALLPQQYPQNK